MTIHESLNLALLLAVEGHAEQVDKLGQPYILHVLRVVHAQTDPVCQIIAILCDTIENTPLTLELLRAANFDPAVVDGVQAMTKGPSEPYREYIQRLSANPFAVPVKIAVLMDNMDPSRRPAVMTGKDIDTQTKYQWALDFLLKLSRPQPAPEPLVQISL